MKKTVILLIFIIAAMVISACSNQTAEINTTEPVISDNLEQTHTQPNDTVTTVSGSFTVCVRDVIPDYCLDDTTPNTAVVTQFQSPPFTVYVGEEIGRQLEAGKAYVFTIKPTVADYPKEYLEKMSLSSLIREVNEFEITNFRLANENELGLASLCLTIE